MGRHGAARVEGTHHTPPVVGKSGWRGVPPGGGGERWGFGVPSKIPKSKIKKNNLSNEYTSLRYTTHGVVVD